MTIPENDSARAGERSVAEQNLSIARSRLRATIAAVRPEFAAGSFPRDDGAVQFYTRINALLTPTTVLLDYGCGRGRQFDIPQPGYREALQKFQGKVARVIGVDLYDGVFTHPYLDERYVIRPDEAICLQPSTVDIVVADWVFEHLDNPAHFAAEMERIVRPGGYVCARTVNRWGYVGMGARLFPNSMHSRLLRRLIPVAQERDVFPVHYRMNSLRDIRRWFSAANWENFSYLVNPTPRYFGNSTTLFRLISLYQRLAPYPFSTDLFVFLRRR